MSSEAAASAVGKPSYLCYAIVVLSALMAAENIHDLWASRQEKTLSVKHTRQIIGVTLSLMVTFLMFIHCCQCKSEMYFWILSGVSAAIGIALSFEESKWEVVEEEVEEE